MNSENIRYKTVIEALENNTEIIIPLLKEVPEENLKRRPLPGKWSAHEHFCHLAEVHSLFFRRLDLMLTLDNPVIKPYNPDKDDEEDALLKIDLNEALTRFAGDRKKLVEKLKNLSVEQWERTAQHPEYTLYSVYILFRHAALHDMLHAYRIEELRYKKDW